MRDEERLSDLSGADRAVLAALVLTGGATIDVAAVRDLAEVEDAERSLRELERRGLVRRDEQDGVLAPAWARLEQTLQVVDRAELVLRNAVTLAATGRLSPEAVLGLTGWAARHGRQRELLTLVRAAKTGLAIERRVEAWRALLARADAAARELGDAGAAAWVRRELGALELASVTTTTQVSRGRGRSAWRRHLLEATALGTAGAIGLVAAILLVSRPDPTAGATVVTTVREVETEVVTTTVRETGTVTETVPTTVVETVTETVTETVPVPTTVTETVPTTVTETVTAPPDPGVD